MRQLSIGLAVWLFAMNAVAHGQNTAVPSSEAAAFLGTWTFAMTNPPNSVQTVKIEDRNGVIAASIQVGRLPPPTDITGIFKDGQVLVLTTTLRENGAPIWAVIALTLDGQTMTMAQMLQQSQTIKRGTGQKQ
jgi:hypothetical protein